MVTGHKKQWEVLKKSFENGSLAHAYLFSGQDKDGIKNFAEKFAEFIGCKFPDLMIVKEANEKDYKFGDGGEITISQIRKVQEFLSYKAYNGSFKVVIIDEAEKINQEAQNCFLKTLEEPKGQTLIILISSKPDLLLKTVVSRCQEIKFLGTNTLEKNLETTKREQEILKQVLPLEGAGLAEKFKYIKSIDFESQNAVEIIIALQKHFQKKILEDVKNKKIFNFLKQSENILQKLLFTNASQKLALEILLMEL